MKIRTKLTWLYTFISGFLLLLFALLIYFSAKNNREKEFFELLQKEAITKANLLLYGEIDAGILQTIYLNNRQFLHEVEVAVFTDNDSLLYHDAVEIDVVKETASLLQKIKSEGIISFFQGPWQVIGMRFEKEGISYSVTAAAFDDYGTKKINLLRNNLLLGWFFSLVLSALAGYFFSKKAFEPVDELRKKAALISENNLHLRLPSLDPPDEIAALANAFNALLERLESSFEAQKHLVSTLSHELRTPLTAMHAELDLALSQSHSTLDFKKVLQVVKDDTTALIRLSNSLLDLAKASYDPSQISKQNLRADELIIEAQAQLLRAYPDFKIEISFDDSAQESELWVYGNSYLLHTAFVNILDNACKYASEKVCWVRLSKEHNTLQIECCNAIDYAPEIDPKLWFSPFYRDPHTQKIAGSGIGLYLCEKILRLHQADITPLVDNNMRVCMQLRFPLL